MVEIRPFFFTKFENFNIIPDHRSSSIKCKTFSNKNVENAIVIKSLELLKKFISFYQLNILKYLDYFFFKIF